MKTACNASPINPVVAKKALKTYSAILLVCLLFGPACKKDDTGITLTLPAKTQSGKNSFGFLLNNAVWTNYGQVCFPFAGGCRENLIGRFYHNDGVAHVSADKVLKKNGSWHTIESIGLELATNFQGPKKYSTTTNDVIGVAYFLSEQGKEEISYLLSATNPVFTITLLKVDTVNHILSGEFSGTVFRRISESSAETSATDSIVINDGRFDIKYY